MQCVLPPTLFIFTDFRKWCDFSAQSDALLLLAVLDVLLRGDQLGPHGLLRCFTT